MNLPSAKREGRSGASAKARESALVIVRSACTHDSRAIRVAKTLERVGYRPLVLAVTSDEVSSRHSVQQGIPILRLSPASPFPWLRSLLQGSSGAGAPAASGGQPREPGDRIPRGLAGARRGSALGRLLTRLHRWIRTMDYYRRAIGIVRSLRPGLIHCKGYNTMWVGVVARALGSTAVVYDANELWPDRNLRPEPRWWLLACEYLFVRSAHRTITPSPGYAEVMARRYRIKSPPVVRNIPAIRPPPDHRPRLARGEKIAVYSGGVTTGRGLEQLISALPHLDGARVRMVGGGHDSYRRELARLAERLGVGDRVALPEPVSVEEVIPFLASADVGVALIQPTCLSYELSLPNKLFEYIAAGLPILASDIPVIGAFVREHELGLVVSPDDPEEIAHKLGVLLDDAENGSYRAAVERARQQWSPERELGRLAAVYGEAMASRAG
jgi:glycosyltransferase involved in cell wall biosynthesis